MKNIVIVAPILSGQGGTETVITKVINEFKTNDKMNVKLLLLGEPKNTEWLDKIDKKDVIICKSKSKIFRIIWYFVFLLKKKYSDIVIINTQLIHITHLIRRFLKLNVRIYSWIHFSLLNSNTVNLKFLREADRHLAISSGIKKQLIDLDVPEDRINLVYNPISVNDHTIQKSNDGVFRFLYVGRIEYNHQKNMESFLNALSKIKGEWQLQIIGDGEDVKQCKSLSKKLGIERKLVWDGWKKYPWKEVSMVDSLVLPSNYEGLPMVLLEALSYGIPCVATDCPTGPEDIIVDKANGRLTKVNDSNDLAEKLQWMMNNSKSMGSDDLKTSINKFYDINYFETLKRALLLEKG